MRWFEEQIAKRSQEDNAAMRTANLKLSSVIMGQKQEYATDTMGSNAERAIAAYYRVDTIKELLQREVRLTDHWYKEALGAMLGKTSAGGAIALIPGKRGRFYYHDPATGKRVKATAQSPIESKAVCFYKQFPARALSLVDLYRFTMQLLSKKEIAYYLLCLLATVLLGLFLPYINMQLFTNVVPSGNMFTLAAIASMLCCIIFASTLMNACSSLAISRIQTKIDVAVSPAVYMRMLSLPVTFFRRYASGELMERAEAIKNLNTLLFGSILSTSISFLFSLFYVLQINRLIPVMSSYAIWMLVAFLLLSLSETFVSLKVTRKNMNIQGKLTGLMFQLLSGIQKIKLTGSEKRAYAKWADLYADSARLLYNPPGLIKLSGVFNSGLTVLGTLLFFAVGAKNHISAADYMAFSVAYGLMCSAALSLGSIISSAAKLVPNWEMAKPILETIPENYADKSELKGSVGSIELSHASFRYQQESPLILDDFSLKIRKGEYLAIVGKTGCGKSTLLRLLMGFEKIQKGAIYYNGISLDNLNIQSLRRRMGIVTQTSRLFPGSIFSNIAACRPTLTQEQAWEIARIVGLEEDIKSMPMGMHTLINKSGGGLSGGQRQRLMIARAIATKPDVLIFDEATSALDNITQRQVSDSLDAFQCTRIVIAHRLSTIRNCNRIIVIKEGKIVEDGTYQSLIEQNGYFAELVNRQMNE